ncbi:uroporphyrinogen-III synthase [Psychrobacillus sp. FSL K6-1267]|uniref:uroporphyrinogen-III synthase n=1 Tax=Psychrobacillus sp. FSL K6-1267 TaxID=2921543 RepID=UPI0030F76CD1
MSESSPLQNEHVIFTGVNRSEEAAALTASLGGVPILAPFIATKEIIQTDDKDKLLNSNAFKWFIFTSQASVAAFHQKILRNNLEIEYFQVKIAAVGSRTASALEQLGFSIDFMPSVFSADVFIREFPQVAAPEESCLFFRGNLAKKTIVDGLVNPVDEWTVYETVTLEDNVEKVKEILNSGKNCSLVFTSPSTVNAFHQTIGKDLGYHGFTVCAIGHVTKNHLKSLGITAQVMPRTYTLTEVVYALAQWKG